MRLSTQAIDRTVIVSVAGAVESHAAGHLYDVLVDHARGDANLIVDLSDVHVMTRAGVRGLVVAAKLMRHARGGMRICGAQRSVEVFLHKLGFHHLLKCDRTLAASMAQLGIEEIHAKPAAAVAPFRRPAPARTMEQSTIGAEHTGEDAVVWRRQA